MRRRLLGSTLAAVGVALVLLGLPLAVAVRASLTRSALDVLQAEVEQTEAVLAQEASSPAATAAILEFLAERGGRRYTLLDRAGRVVVDTGAQPAPPGATALTPDVELSRSRLSAAAHRGPTTLAVAMPVAVGGAGLILRVADSDAALDRQVRQAWLAIAGLAVSALGAAALLALWQGRRLASPLEELAGSARRLGDGDFSARAPRSGLPEADEVAAALDTTAARLGAMLERSRSFGADASHQLRTPLTALRLDLEALEVAGADPPLVAAAMAETDRLEATIDELLTLAEPPRGEELVDLGRLAAARLDAWQSLARSQGRRVLLDAAPAAPVRARAAALGQCLQVLLDNALEHGAGTITVSVHPVPGPGVRLAVADEGPGFPPDDAPAPAPSAGGRGLPLARSLVEAEGGRLLVERPERGAVVSLLLPAAVTA